MPDSVRITGWLFIDQESKTIIYVSKNGDSDDTGLPWEVLSEAGNLAAFRRDFGFKLIEIANFKRFKIDVEIDSLRRWFEIREEPK